GSASSKGTNSRNIRARRRRSCGRGEAPEAKCLQGGTGTPRRTSRFKECRRRGMNIIGAPLTRVDGKQKVTGQSKYSAEFQPANLGYAVIVQSTIPAGRISAMNIEPAEHAPGV